MDKKTQNLYLIFAIILFICTGINFIKSFIYIPNWVNIVTGIFLAIDLIFAIVIIVRTFRHRKTK